MIVKKIKHTKTDRPKEWQINALVDYIRNPNEKRKAEKIVHAGGLNFICDAHKAQKLEMIALARESNRSKMPVNHWVFAWPEGEQPTPKQVDELVKMFLEGMGLEGHQAIYGLHGDTKNYHVHIAVNRVHPETFKVVRINNGFDIRQAQKVRALIEQKQGWSPLENAPYVVTEEGEIAQTKSEKEIKLSPKAQDVEARTGEKSGQRIAQERGHEILKTAATWSEVHEKMKAAGLRFEKKGSGAIVWVGETAVKASSIDRAFSMGKLVKRLGDFVPGEYEVEQEKITPEAIIHLQPELMEQFLEEKKEQEETEAHEQKEKEAEIQKLMDKHKREWESKLPNSAEHGLSILNIARHFLKLQQTRERKALLEQLRKKFPKKPKLRFKKWLMQRGKAIAVRLLQKAKSKEIRHTRPPIAPTAQTPQAPSCPQINVFLEYAKAVNAERYRVTSIKVEPDGSRKVLILDKKNGHTNGFTQEELLARMPEILALRKRGENLYYTPLSDGKHHILIDDVTPENVVKLQQDGLKPAVIIESSPGNFQCILTFAKFKGNFDREIGNRLSLMLNKKYGDPKLSGAIHPHRAPGFENRKAKHQRPDGTFPQSILRYAVRQECQKCLVEARKIEQELTQQAKMREQRKPVFSIPMSVIGSQAAYYAHLENIRAHLTIEDFSRVDSMIALRMRANGHSENEVYEAIMSCAPTIREGRDKRRDWQRYAERTINYAFGFAGDRDLAKNEKYRQLWLNIENNNSHQRLFKVR